MDSSISPDNEKRDPDYHRTPRLQEIDGFLCGLPDKRVLRRADVCGPFRTFLRGHMSLKLNHLHPVVSHRLQQILGFCSLKGAGFDKLSPQLEFESIPLAKQGT